jgi:hypothetical protein
MSEPLPRINFLNASVIDFNLNMGWANEPTILTAHLVEDDVINQNIYLDKEYVNSSGGRIRRPPNRVGRFRFMAVGSLQKFTAGDWSFYGIITSYRIIKNASGNPIYEVTLADPREFLAGVQIVIDHYNGFTYGVPNLYNVYGYLEQTYGFGASQVNANGMPWRLIRDTFIQLCLSTPPVLRGVPYILDLSELPNIPEDYRIGSTNISLMDFIQEICEVANHDFTVTMYGNIIKIRTINRNIPLLTGSLSNFVQSLNQVTSLESGFEIQYNPTNKFVVGGQVENMYYQFNNTGFNIGSGNPIVDDTIARYWGKVFNGDVIIADRPEVNISGVQESNEVFAIPATQISFSGSAFASYPTDIEELRASLDSYDSWTTFLVKYRAFDDNGNILEVPANISGSIHYGKYENLSLFSNIRTDNIAGKFIQQLGVKDLANLSRNATLKNSQQLLNQKVYDFISSYANEHLDKKFMVRVPFVQAKLEENGVMTTSMKPISSAYLEESLLPSAVFNNLLPNSERFSFNDEGKTEAYVRFGPFNYEDLDTSEIPPDDYEITNPASGVNFIFVKCQVEPELVFVDRSVAYSPRAVITLPGRVKHLNGLVTLGLLEAEYLANQHPDNLEIASDFLSRWKNHVGADPMFQERSNFGLTPGMAAIPLKSNVNTYGPWYTNTGTAGNLEFIQDHSLTPWNFGGHAGMNAAGTALVQSAYVANVIGEHGVVEVPGGPAHDLATQVASGGPVISQIGVSIGDNGLTTTYRMEKWNQTYNKQVRHRIEQFKRSHELRRENRRRFTEIFTGKNNNLDKTLGRVSFRPPSFSKPKRRNRNSTHTLLMASTYEKEDGYKSYNIGTLPYYLAGDVLDNDEWGSVAGASLDSLFVPFSTDSNLTNASGMNPETSGVILPSGSGGLRYLPNFEKPVIGTVHNANSLNPFKPGHNIGVAVRGSGHLDINNTTYGPVDVYRGMGLKTPLVLAGWGYDIGGNPVPSNGSGGFHEDYLKDPTLWKCGPLDVRWDDRKKVWNSSGASLFFQLIEDMPTPHGSRAWASFVDWEKSELFQDYVYNWGKDEGIIRNYPAGFFGVCDYIIDRYGFIQAECGQLCDTSVSIPVQSPDPAYPGQDDYIHDVSINGSPTSGSFGGTLPSGWSIDPVTGRISGPSGGIVGNIGDEIPIIVTAIGGECTVTRRILVPIEEAPEE